MKTISKKHILCVALGALLVLFMPFVLSACKKETYYTVTFDADNGTTNVTEQVEENKKVTEPTAPTKEGYTFAGWYKAETRWNFETDVVLEDLTLKAHWTDVRVPVFTTQPHDASISYPNGATFTVAVEHPELVESYQWQEWMKGSDDDDDEGDEGKLKYDGSDLEATDEETLKSLSPILTSAVWRNMEGISATTPTLELKSTEQNSYHCKFRCVVTYKNGKSAKSEEAGIILDNKNEFVPFVRIGDYAVEPGETLDLAGTPNGTGKISMARVTNDRYDITLDHVDFDNTKTISSEIYASIGLEMLSYSNTARYYYIHLIGNNNFKNVRYDPDLNAAGIPFCFNWLSDSIRPIIYIDGSGMLTLNGGTELIYSNSAVEIMSDLNLQSTKDVYGNGIKCANLIIDNDVTIHADLNGSLAILKSNENDGNISIGNNVNISANISIGRVGVGLTSIGLLKANHKLKIDNATISMIVNTEADRFVPTEQGVAQCFAMYCNNAIEVRNSNIKIKMYADEGKEGYWVSNYYGMYGNNIEIIDSKLDIAIDSPVIDGSTAIYVAPVVSEDPTDSNELYVSNSDVNLFAKTIGGSCGIRVISKNAVGVAIINSTSANIVVDSYDETPKSNYGVRVEHVEDDQVSGFAISNATNVDITCTHGPALIVYTGLGEEAVEFDEGYVPKFGAIIQNSCVIIEPTPTNATKNAYCTKVGKNRYYYFETIYDKNNTEKPAHHVQFIKDVE